MLGEDIHFQEKCLHDIFKFLRSATRDNYKPKCTFTDTFVFKVVFTFHTQANQNILRHLCMYIFLHFCISVLKYYDIQLVSTKHICRPKHSNILMLFTQNPVKSSSECKLSRTRAPPVQESNKPNQTFLQALNKGHAPKREEKFNSERIFKLFYVFICIFSNSFIFQKYCQPDTAELFFTPISLIFTLVHANSKFHHLTIIIIHLFLHLSS